MRKQILDVSNLVEAIENNMISIVSVKPRSKASIDITERDPVTPEKFTESIQFLNKTIFKDAIDFSYEFTGKNSVLIEYAIKNPYFDECFYVECVISDDVSIDEVDKKLR